MTMRAVLATHGTIGSLEPLLGLARGLERRGHAAVIAAPPHLGQRARDLGLAFVPIGPQLEPEELARMFGGARAAADSAGQARHVTEATVQHLEQSYEELVRACAGADLLVAFPAQLAAGMVHERTAITFASIHFSPFGSVGARQMGDAIAPVVNARRAELGFPPLSDPLGGDGFSSRLSLFPVSPLVFRRPRKWPPHFRLTGYLFVDEASEPDRGLAEFVAGGDPPVVVTFGSMIHREPEQMTALLVAAIERVGCRAVIQQGWSGLGAQATPSMVFVTGFASHAWLFPRAGCVVHAGGAGTTAAALRAGAPQVVIPHWLDQPMWAQLVLGLGCASAVIPETRLAADDLARAIDAALRGDRHRDKARRLAAQLAAEDGVGVACDLLERLARSEDVTA